MLPLGWLSCFLSIMSPSYPLCQEKKIMKSLNEVRYFCSFIIYLYKYLAEYVYHSNQVISNLSNKVIFSLSWKILFESYIIFTMIWSKQHQENKKKHDIRADISYRAEKNKCVWLCWPAVEQVLIDVRAETSCLTKLVKTLSWKLPFPNTSGVERLFGGLNVHNVAYTRYIKLY